MNINGINGINSQMGQVGMNQATDSYSREIQNQIANAQKQLQELSSNEDMTPEEKMKRRQEIQQQINDLNMQLRQHQMELRRERQQAKDFSADDMPDETRKAGSKSTGLSQASMTAMISADNSIKQAKMQGSVATSMEREAGILEAEIKLDTGRGVSAEIKEEKLADLKQKAQTATESQFSNLADADKTLEDAAKAERTDGEGTKTADANDKDAKENEFGTVVQKKMVTDSENKNIQSSGSAPENTSVDIRL